MSCLKRSLSDSNMYMEESLRELWINLRNKQIEDSINERTWRRFVTIYKQKYGISLRKPKPK